MVIAFWLTLGLTIVGRGQFVIDALALLGGVVICCLVMITVLSVVMLVRNLLRPQPLPEQADLPFMLQDAMASEQLVDMVERAERVA